MNGWELDKDILFDNNKVYGEKTCCLVPKELNMLFTNYKENGISISKRTNKYSVYLCYNYKKLNFGTYYLLEDAKKVYIFEKNKLIKKIYLKYLGLVSENVSNKLFYEIF